MEIELSRFDITEIKDDKVVVLIGKRETGKSFLCKDILFHHSGIPGGQGQGPSHPQRWNETRRKRRYNLRRPLSVRSKGIGDWLVIRPQTRLWDFFLSWSLLVPFRYVLLVVYGLSTQANPWDRSCRVASFDDDVFVHTPTPISGRPSLTESKFPLRRSKIVPAERRAILIWRVLPANLDSV